MTDDLMSVLRDADRRTTQEKRDRGGRPGLRRLLARFRTWWHQPVLDLLDAIERNTRRDTATVTPPTRIHIEPGITTGDIAKALRRQMRSARPRSPSITHGICGWCEQTVELVINNGLVWLSDHAYEDRTCIGSGSEDYQPVEPRAVS